MKPWFDDKYNKYKRRTNINIEIPDKGDIVKTKNFFKRKYKKFIAWLNWKKNKEYNYKRRLRYITNILIGLIISVVAFIVFYSNIEKLNEIRLWIVKVGSVLLLISLYFVIKYGWRVLKEIHNWFKRERNWIRFIIIIGILFLAWYSYTNKDTILNPLFDYYDKTDLKAIYSPIHLEEGKEIISNIKEEVNDIILEDPEKYKTNPKTVILPSLGNYVVYGGLNDYLAGLDRSLSYYYTPPTTRDFILRDLDNDIQRAYLNPLVDKIKEKSDNPNNQAVTTIEMVQGIPYDWDAFKSDSVTGRYPYEVLYDMKGVCMEKADLMAFLLRELGFGVVIFEFKLESHRAVGIKCENGNYNSEYCFIEPTDYYPIGSIPQNYVGGADISGATPEIVIISEGRAYPK